MRLPRPTGFWRNLLSGITFVVEFLLIRDIPEEINTEFFDPLRDPFVVIVQKQVKNFEDSKYTCIYSGDSYIPYLTDYVCR